MDSGWARVLPEISDKNSLEENRPFANKEIRIANGLVCRNGKAKTQENGKSVQKPREKTTALYYGGPRGALLLVVFAPAFVMMINLMCTKHSCTAFKLPKFPTDLSEYFDLSAFYMLLSWIGITLGISSLPVGSWFDGQPSANGRILKYRLNGSYCVTITIITAIVLGHLPTIPLYVIHQKTTSFITLSIILSLILSTYTYFRSFKVSHTDLSPYGNTGNGIYDFFMGRELNPRIGNFDLKQFCLRFGMLSWFAYDVSLIASQRELHGQIMTTLLLMVLGHTVAILEFFVFEEKLLTSFTINHQGTGFLLIFGSSVFVPYVFSLNARYIVEMFHQVESEPLLIGIFAFLAVGHVLYRFTNADKSLFLRYPDFPEVAHYEFIEAEDGKRILVDGWWATVRHPNYSADILIGIGWCIITGFNDIISYTYVIFQVLFTLHHLQQNEEMCHQEFGKAWDEYCQKVKYKLIKHVY